MREVIKRDNKELFQIKSALNKQIRTTQNYWQKITIVKHPSINSIFLLCHFETERSKAQWSEKSLNITMQTERLYLSNS